MTNSLNQHNRPQEQKFTINLLTAFIFVFVLALTLQNRQWTQFCFSNVSYYVILLLVASWVLCFIIFCQSRQMTFKGFIAGHGKGLLISFILAGTIFMSVPNSYRVLSDETNLLSVSKAMTFNKKVDNVTEGKWYYGMFWQIAESNTEKRPFLFPFCVSLSQMVLGYHPHNVFFFNFLVYGGLLFLIYLLMSPYLGILLSVAAMLAVSAQPMVVLSATSASFEVFNLFFILLSFLSLRSFLKNPTLPGLLFLTLNLIMLANIRYESIIFLVVVGGVLLAARRLKFSYLGETSVWGIFLFFLLPLIWQRVIMLGVSDSNLQGGSWIKAFSVGHFGHNMQLFFQYVLSPTGSLGFAGVLNLFGLLALVFWTVKFFVSKSHYLQWSKMALWSSALISLTGIFILMLFYQGHIADHPMNGRLYIPILFVLSIAPIYAVVELFKGQARVAMPVMVVAGILFFYYHPVAMEDKLSNQLYIVRDFKHVLDFLQKNAQMNDLIICGRPGQLIIYNYGAISFSTANSKKGEILSQYQNRLFNKLYVVQEVSYKTKAPEPTNVVAPEYQLRTIKEIQGGKYVLRISEVILPSS